MDGWTKKNYKRMYIYIYMLWFVQLYLTMKLNRKNLTLVIEALHFECGDDEWKWVGIAVEKVCDCKDAVFNDSKPKVKAP